MADVVILIILVIAAWMGYAKGLIRSLIGLAGGLVSLLGTFILAKPLASALAKPLGVVAKISEKVQALIPMPEDLEGVRASIDGVAALYEFLNNSHLPKGLEEGILNGVSDQIYHLGEGAFLTMAEAVAQVIAAYIWQGIVFAVLWLILSVAVVWGSRLMLGILHRIPLIGTIDRVAGALVFLLLFCLILAVLYDALGVFIGLNTDNAILAALNESAILPLLQSVFRWSLHLGA